MKYSYLITGVVSSSLLFASCGKKQETTTHKDNKQPTTTTSKTPVKEEKVEKKPNAIMKMLEGKTSILKGDSFTPTTLVNTDYYLLYFTASW